VISVYLGVVSHIDRDHDPDHDPDHDRDRDPDRDHDPDPDPDHDRDRDHDPDHDRDHDHDHDPDHDPDPDHDRQYLFLLIEYIKSLLLQNGEALDHSQLNIQIIRQILGVLPFPIRKCARFVYDLCRRQLHT
jgi:hypothetical protein